MGWIGCVHCEKPRRDFVARTFALIAPVYPVLHRLSCSYKKIINAPKHYATQQNMSLGSNGVDWLRSLWKISMWLRGTSLCINCTIPNASKHYATHQDMSLGSNGADWVCSLRKTPTWLRGTNFCINCTSLPHFASSFMQLQKDNKRTQTLCNTPKHEFRVQRSGLGVFVAKNLDATSWHKLVH